MRKNLKKNDPKRRQRQALADHARWAWIESTPLGRRLAPIIYVFYWDRRAFYTLTAIVLVSALALTAMSPFIRTVPKDVEAPRISVIDWFQARALANTARSAQNNNKPEVARLAWKTAIANNSGDLQNLRAYLEFELAESSRGATEISEPQFVLANWILTLDPESPKSRSIALQVFEAGRDFDALYNHVDHEESEVQELRDLQLRAFFFQGEMARFREAARGLKADDPAAQGARSLLLARDALWGTRIERSNALAELLKLTESEDSAELAHRVLLRVHFNRRDIDGYSKSLRALSELGADRLEERIALWDLLAGFGRGQEAQRLALQYSKPPRRVSEAAKMVLAYMGLGLPQEPLPFLRRYEERFRSSGAFQTLLALELMRHEAWEELVSHSVSMRSVFANSESYTNLAHLIEAIALQGKGYDPLVDRTLEKLDGETKFPADALTSMAEVLIAQERIPSIEIVLERLSETAMDPNAYWALQAQLASLRGDVDLGYRAAKRLYELRPSSSSRARDYMIAEFYQRNQPAKALSLSRRLRDTFPASTALMPLHAYALAINGRLSEASEWLTKLSSRPLSEEDAIWTRLAELEIHTASANWERAEKISTETYPRNMIQTAIYKRLLSLVEEALQKEEPPS